MRPSPIVITLPASPQAYIGELSTTESAEGLGVGTALVEACEQGAREQGYSL